jgi:hypothetical protein
VIPRVVVSFLVSSRLIQIRWFAYLVVGERRGQKERASKSHVEGVLVNDKRMDGHARGHEQFNL